MTAATMTTKGQITIPKDIRAKLDLQAGDKVDFVIDGAGEVRFIPVTKDVSVLKGIVPVPVIPVSVQAMNETTKKRGGRV